MKQSALLLNMILLSWGAFSQQNPVLTIHSFKVEVNNQQIPYDQTFEEYLIEDVPKEITLYEGNGLRYVTSFEYARSGNRIKLIRRAYVQKKNDKLINGKRKKDVQFIKVSIPRKIEGRSRENFLIDKENLESIFVTYLYQFNY